MFAYKFITWWYGEGWMTFGRGVIHRIRRTSQAFSVDILLRTMFAPWRRIISTNSGTITDQLRSVVDNIVSRCVGFTVRLFALITALLIILLTTIIGGIFWILWPTLPIIVIGLLSWGIIK